MADIAQRDPNYVPAIQGVSSIDGETVTDIWVDPTTHGLIVDPSSLDSRFIMKFPTGSENLISVNTATSEALILQTTDDDATKNLFEAFKADGTTYLASLTADGKLGVGVDPSKPLHVFNATNEQLRLDYDTTNFVDLGGSSIGRFNIKPSGGKVDIYAASANSISMQLRGSSGGLIAMVHDGTTGSFSNFIGNYNITNVAAGSLNFRTSNVDRINIDLDGAILIPNAIASVIPLTVKGAVSQTANLTEWQNSSGTALAYFKAGGTLQIDVPTATTEALILKSTDDAATKNLFEVQKADGTVGMKIRAATATNSAALQFQYGSRFLDQSTRALFTPSSSRFDILNEAGNEFVLIIDGRTAGQTGIFTNDASKNLVFSTGAAKSIIFKAATSQTANLTEWKNSSGGVLSNLSADNTLTLGNSTAGTNGKLVTVIIQTDISADNEGNEFTSTIQPTGATTRRYIGSAMTQSWKGAFNATARLSSAFSGIFQNSSVANSIQYATAFESRIHSIAGGSITNAYNYHVTAPYITAGTITNLYGFYVDNVSAGTSLNYAIYTNAGAIHAGDKIEFTQTDGNEYIDSLADGYMDYGATLGHRFNNTLDITTTTDPQLRLTHTDGVDETDFYTNSDGELEIMPTARTIFLGDGTAGDSTFGFYGNTSVYTLIHDDSEGELSLSANDVTNKSVFEADGTLRFDGTATVWKDINMGAAQLSRPAASQPDEANFLTEAGADTGITTLAYAIGEKASGAVEMQHDYKEGSNLTFHVHWQGIAAPSGTDNVQWRITYVLMRDGTTLDAVTIVDTVDTAIDTQYESYRSDFSVIDGSTKGNNGTPIQIGDQFLFTIERVASTGDAYAGDALVATIGFHYEVDTVGSRTISAK